jgi:UPF0716 family protein affecting phage T7 exclusion
MCGALFLGFWWIVPLVAFAMCLGFMTLRFLGAGHGFMSHRRTPNGAR